MTIAVVAVADADMVSTPAAVILQSSPPMIATVVAVLVLPMVTVSAVVELVAICTVLTMSAVPRLMVAADMAEKVPVVSATKSPVPVLIPLLFVLLRYKVPAEVSMLMSPSADIEMRPAPAPALLAAIVKVLSPALFAVMVTLVVSVLSMESVAASKVAPAAEERIRVPDVVVCRVRFAEVVPIVNVSPDDWTMEPLPYVVDAPAINEPSV